MGVIWAYNSTWRTRSDCENLVDSLIESWLFLCTPLVTRCLSWQIPCFFLKYFILNWDLVLKAFFYFLKSFPKCMKLLAFWYLVYRLNFEDVEKTSIHLICFEYQPHISASLNNQQWFFHWKFFVDLSWKLLAAYLYFLAL